MKKIIPSIIILLSLTSCSKDNESKCKEIANLYNNAVEVYHKLPSMDNCIALERASMRYMNSNCAKADIEIPKCNPYLLNLRFQFTIDMSLPQYSQLQFASNPVYVNGPNYGNGGVIIINTGSGSYRAFDASDPNHPATGCSVLAIDGIEGYCGCEDGNAYNLFTGQALSAGLEYPLLEYRVTNNGNGTLTVSN